MADRALFGAGRGLFIAVMVVPTTTECPHDVCRHAGRAQFEKQTAATGAGHIPVRGQRAQHQHRQGDGEQQALSLTAPVKPLSAIAERSAPQQARLSLPASRPGFRVPGDSA